MDEKITLTLKDPTKVSESEFEFREDLTDVVIPDGVTEICAGAFCDCLNMRSVVIPNSVTKIGDSAFNGCSALESVVIPD